MAKETREQYLRRTAGSPSEAVHIMNRRVEPEQNALALVIGCWTFEFVPDGLDPGVGNLTVTSRWGNPHQVVQTSQDDVQRDEWDAFVRGATL